MTAVRELMTEAIRRARPTRRQSTSRGSWSVCVHAVFVLDDDGWPAGVVSDKDVIAGESPGCSDTGQGDAQRDRAAADDLAGAHIDIGADVTDAAARLAEARVGRLLVVDDGRPGGVLSVSDVVAFIGDRPRPRETPRAGHVPRDRGQPARGVDRRSGAGR
jgi:CBS domain-containing protein